MDVGSQLSSPPLRLQLHGTQRRAWPDEATSVCKTHPRRGRCQLPPCAPPRPPPEGCDLRPPRVTVHLHLTRPKTCTDQTNSLTPHGRPKLPGHEEPACLMNCQTGCQARGDQLGPEFPRREPGRVLGKARPEARLRDSPRRGFEFSGPEKLRLDSTHRPREVKTSRREARRRTPARLRVPAADDRALPPPP